MKACGVKEKNNFGSPKATLLKDGTVCYTKPVRYPANVLRALRKLWFEKDCGNMTEAIFYCIDNHKNYTFDENNSVDVVKKDLKSLTIRFRQRHYDYILQICEKEGLASFSEGVIHVLYEYLNIEERL